MPELQQSCITNGSSAKKVNFPSKQLSSPIQSKADLSFTGVSNFNGQEGKMARGQGRNCHLAILPPCRFRRNPDGILRNPYRDLPSCLLTFAIPIHNFVSIYQSQVKEKFGYLFSIPA